MLFVFPLLFFYWQVCLYFVSFALNHKKNKKKPETSLRPPHDTYLRQAYSKLALQSTDYCAAFTQSR